MVSLEITPTNYLDHSGLCLLGPMVRYEIEAKVTFYCEFDYSAYPKDHLICKLRLGGLRPNVRFILENRNSSSISSMGQTKTHIEFYDVLTSVVEEKLMTNDEIVQSIGLDIQIQRGVRPFVLKYYLPCATITLVSQLSFIIPLTALPGRVALLVTQFLTLTSLFIHQMVYMFSIQCIGKIFSIRRKLFNKLCFTNYSLIYFIYFNNRENRLPDRTWITYHFIY